MRITADTNILARAIVGDDPTQSAAARAALAAADTIAIPAVALCELVWLLRRGYGTPRAEIAPILRRLIAARGVVVDRPCVEAGLRVLEAGGDFADGVIAYEGRWLGGETFLSFDREAVSVLTRSGVAAQAPD